jgi:hypothetical protein
LRSEPETKAKPLAYTILLALALAGVVWVVSLAVGSLLENYGIYVGIEPFGTWVYPLAPFAELARLTGKIGALLSFTLVFATGILKGTH